MNARAIIDSLRYDQRNGVGAVPKNVDVDYFGFETEMTPDEFLALALPLSDDDKGEGVYDQGFEKLISQSAIGSPFFNAIWTDNAEWKVTGHEGRHRMKAIKKLYGNIPVTVHVFPAGLRARDVTPDMVKAWNAGRIVPES